MKIVSRGREKARRVYYGAVFEAKKEIPSVFDDVLKKSLTLRCGFSAISCSIGKMKSQIEYRI